MSEKHTGPWKAQLQRIDQKLARERRSSSYQEGTEAAEAGDPVDSNPYDPDEEESEFENWEASYDDWMCEHGRSRRERRNVNSEEGQQGADAYDSGSDETDNPYLPNTQQGKDWLDGFYMKANNG